MAGGVTPGNYIGCAQLKLMIGTMLLNHNSFLPQAPHTSECPRDLIVAVGDLGRSPRMMNQARAPRARGWSWALAGCNLVMEPAVAEEGRDRA